MMNLNYDCDIRLDKFGQPDLNYYIEESKRLRALAIAQLFHGATLWLKLQLGKLHGLPLRPSL